MRWIVKKKGNYKKDANEIHDETKPHKKLLSPRLGVNQSGNDQEKLTADTSHRNENRDNGD